MKQDPAKDLHELLDSLLSKGVTIQPGEAVELPLSLHEPLSIRIEVESPLPHPSSLSASRPVLAIVSRDRPALFSALKGRLEPEYGQVIWDRRATTRRADETSVPTERRKADRREAPPTSWEVWGFLMIRQVAPEVRDA